MVTEEACKYKFKVRDEGLVRGWPRRCIKIKAVRKRFEAEI